MSSFKRNMPRLLSRDDRCGAFIIGVYCNVCLQRGKLSGSKERLRVVRSAFTKETAARGRIRTASFNHLDTDPDLLCDESTSVSIFLGKGK